MEIFVPCTPKGPNLGGFKWIWLSEPTAQPLSAHLEEAAMVNLRGLGVENCWNSFLRVPGFSVLSHCQNKIHEISPYFQSLHPKPARGHKSKGICVFTKLTLLKQVLIFQFKPSHETNRSFKGSKQNWRWLVKVTGQEAMKIITFTILISNL